MPHPDSQTADACVLDPHAPGGGDCTGGKLAALALGALGVVYGDIGTSPLYAVKECFHGMHAVELTKANVLGVLSLIFWSLMMVVSVKYVGFILRADNKGEGGIFALLELTPKPGEGMSRTAYGAVTLMALAGAALLYGESVITPAISVLSAVEGLSVATTAAEPLILPIALVILVGLFLIQKFGTAGIGTVFGPTMVVWFTTIGGFGLMRIIENPEVLEALNPAHGLDFLRRNGLGGMYALGSVVLCITGGEALFADLGHFGRRAIRISWLVAVLPGLLLSYFGQGAGLLANPDIATNPFFGIVPEFALYPMVLLATMAAIIASQAMISGIFSLTRQGVQLGFIPRTLIVHTSEEMEGQIYIPEINFLLMLVTLALTLTFRQSSNLAGAYGISVTATMTMTSCIYFFIAHRRWKWPLWKIAPLVGLFLLFDVTYFSSNLLKLPDGGWVTLLIAGAAVAVMTSWRKGRRVLSRRLSESIMPLDAFLADMERARPYRVPGTAVFMTLSPVGVPVTLLHFFKHNQVLHERVFLLSIRTGAVPFVKAADRLRVESLGQGFHRLVADYGFMETPDVPEIMRLAAEAGLENRPEKTTFFLGRETLLTTGRSELSGWRKRLFAIMSRNAPPATTYFKIPPNRVMELGVLIEI